MTHSLVVHTQTRMRSLEGYVTLRSRGRILDDASSNRTVFLLLFDAGQSLEVMRDVCSRSCREKSDGDLFYPSRSTVDRRWTSKRDRNESPAS